MKKVIMVAFIAFILALCACAPAAVSEPTAAPLLSRIWNGIEVTRALPAENRNSGLTAVNSVMTVEEDTLELHFKRGLGNMINFGPEWFVQVRLDGLWYDIPSDSRMDSALSAGDSFEVEEKLSFDLSDFDLPAGEYRFALKYSLPRLLEKKYICAPFWVINPGDEIPSASLTSGEADYADILLSASSEFPARPAITDADTMLMLHIENLSGKNYECYSLKLEKLGEGEPEVIKYKHANKGLAIAWMEASFEIFLDEGLAPGKYRLTPTLYSGLLYSGFPSISPEIEFDVIAESEAPEPHWNSADWLPSAHDSSSERIHMTLGDTNLGGDNSELHVSLDCDANYQYGEFFTLEAKIGDYWFPVPNAYSAGFLLLAYSTDLRDSFVLDLERSHGALPPGQYRLVMEFDEVNYSSVSAEHYLSREIAFAEFEITEPIK